MVNWIRISCTSIFEAHLEKIFWSQSIFCDWLNRQCCFELLPQQLNKSHSLYKTAMKTQQAWLSWRMCGVRHLMLSLFLNYVHWQGKEDDDSEDDEDDQEEDDDDEDGDDEGNWVIFILIQISAYVRCPCFGKLGVKLFLVVASVGWQGRATTQTLMIAFLSSVYANRPYSVSFI